MPPGLMRLPNGKLVPRPTTQGPLLKKPTYSTQPPSNMMVGPRGYSTPRKVHDPFFTVEQFAKNAWDTIGNAEHAANVRARQQAQGRQASFPLTNALVGALGFLGGAAKSYGNALYNSYRNPVGGRWGNRQHPFKNLQEAGRYASDHSLLDVPIWPGALPGLTLGGRALGAAADAQPETFLAKTSQLWKGATIHTREGEATFLEHGQMPPGTDGWPGPGIKISLKNPRAGERYLDHNGIPRRQPDTIEKWVPRPPDSMERLINKQPGGNTLGGMYGSGPYKYPLKFGVQASLAQTLGDINKYRKQRR